MTLGRLLARAAFIVLAVLALSLGGCELTTETMRGGAFVLLYLAAICAVIAIAREGRDR